MKRAVALVLFVAAVGLGIFHPLRGAASFLYPLANPGPMSTGHRFLASECFACHIPARGAAAERCVRCHAAETNLLERAPTAFHANVGTCAQCHVEHLGAEGDRPRMEHDTLARIAFEKAAKFRRAIGSSASPEDDQVTDVGEAGLVCTVCHGIEDPHAGLFGTRCMDCHTTKLWRISTFRHPPTDSVDCVQCHVAPRSHTMHHFEMVSRAAAHQDEATVEQCYLCHQPTSWNDIRGVGEYDHH